MNPSKIFELRSCPNLELTPFDASLTEILFCAGAHSHQRMERWVRSLQETGLEIDFKCAECYVCFKGDREHHRKAVLPFLELLAIEWAWDHVTYLPSVVPFSKEWDNLVDTYVSLFLRSMDYHANLANDSLNGSS